jgi:hypothetical protein
VTATRRSCSPDLRDWLPGGHLAWFILDVVDQLDLVPFYRVTNGQPRFTRYRPLTSPFGLQAGTAVALDRAFQARELAESKRLAMCV